MLTWTIRVLAAVALLAAAGCTTIGSQQEMAEEQAQTATQVDNLRSEVARLRERVNAMDAVQQDLYRQLQQSQGSNGDDVRQLKDRVAQLERALDDLQTARAADREQIINSLSTKVSDLMRKSTPASKSAKAEQGYEHVVKAGQTLAAIAAAYKVSPKAIIDANKLKNPNNLRVGQKLFIPAE